MDWTAVFAISVAMLVLALPLSLIGWLVARRQRRKAKQQSHYIIATRAGVAVGVGSTLVALALMAWAEYHPDSWLGRSPGALGLLFGIQCMVWPMILEACGIPCFLRIDNADAQQEPHDDRERKDAPPAP